MSKAIADVTAERLRQIEAEGWSYKHDDTLRPGYLALAGACYADNARRGHCPPPNEWPFLPKWWKQSNPRRDLVKAAALIIAEIEKMDRAERKEVMATGDPLPGRVFSDAQGWEIMRRDLRMYGSAFVRCVRDGPGRMHFEYIDPRNVRFERTEGHNRKKSAASPEASG